MRNYISFTRLLRLLIIFPSLALLICCNHQRPLSTEKTNREKIFVLSTIAMIDDLVGMVAKDRVDHAPLITSEIDPHSYEIVKGDDEKIADADLLLYNGLGLEHGASLTFQIQQHPHSIAIAECIAKKSTDNVLQARGVIDPHVWMDISLWVQGIDPIVQALIELDPEGAAYYRHNAEVAKQTMLSTHEKIVHLLRGIPSHKRYLVTSHDAFGYFARAYLADEDEIAQGTWRVRVAAPEGISPDGQLSSRDIQMIIDHLERFNIGVVFAESNVSQDSLRKIVSASHQKKRNVIFSQRVLFGDAMGCLEYPVSSYLEMIEHNAQSLIQEWQSK